MPHAFTLSDFDFALPPELIAQHPAEERSGARLLDGRSPQPIDRMFREFPGLLASGDLLVFNDTRVIKARLLGHKHSGGAVEALVERVLPGNEVLAHLRASKSPRAGSRVRFVGGQGGGHRGGTTANDTTVNDATVNDMTASDHGFDALMLGRAGPDDALFHLRFPSDPLALLEAHGHVPLPPYITHADSAHDEARYQTVFAARPGAVAAPTAALHFDTAVLQQIEQRGVMRAHVTLHVGAGTFQPVRTQDLSLHKMHSEWFEVSQATVDAVHRTHAAGGRVVAVGTTTLRALESAALGGLRAGSRETDIFITPGFQFQVVDALLTNFHLPKSTLMMLVSAFAGHAHVKALYGHAIANSYRFFSYGDAMLLQRCRLQPAQLATPPKSP